MEKLIEALQIFLKYGNPQFPTHCEHDVMQVNIDVDKVSEEDLKKLKALHFTPDEWGTFKSYHFGSA